MVNYRLKLTDIRQESKDTYTFLMDMPEGFLWEEGAHAHIGIKGYDFQAPNGAYVRHMSIMTLPKEDKIGFTTKKRGTLSLFKETLFNMKVGEELLLFKPGSRMALRRENRPIVLVSMGVGCATMRPLILAYEEESSGIEELIHINIHGDEEALYKQELSACKEERLQSHYVKTRGDMDKFLEETLTLEKPIYYLVGSDAFLIQKTHWLMGKGIAFEDVVLDKKEQFTSRLLMMSPKDLAVML